MENKERKKYFKTIIHAAGSYTKENGEIIYTYGFIDEVWKNKKLVGYEIKAIKTKNIYLVGKEICLTKHKNIATGEYYYKEFVEEEKLPF